MSYIDKTLIFESNKIYYIDGSPLEVMMDWEDPIMSSSAAYVCEGGGDILEIGFGMGISAGYIQSHSITSHPLRMQYFLILYNQHLLRCYPLYQLK